jgi:hypothetical protein
MSFGLQHSWENVTVIVHEEFKDFENFSQAFLPGADPGLSTTDPTSLQFFVLGQSYNFDSRSHTLRVLGRPTSRLHLQGMWRREDLDLDMRASELSKGTDYTGMPFATDLSGQADIGRDLDFAEFELGFMISDRVRLVGAAKRSDLSQNGLLGFGPDVGVGNWYIDTDGYELGMEFAPSSNLTLSVGWSSEARDALGTQLLNGVGAVPQSNTDRDGYYARLVYSHGRGLEFTASIEDNSIDDPFALTSATANKRYRFSARQRWENGWSMTGSYTHTDVENSQSGWVGDTRRADVRVAYRSEHVYFSAGYAALDAEHRIDQLVAAGFRQDLFLISYGSDSEFIDASARWHVNDKITVGADLRNFDNSGSFAVSRDELQTFFEFAFAEDYAVRMAYRVIDHTEDVFDDYDADIFELAIKMKW